MTSSPLRMLAAAALVAALSGPAVSAPKAAPTQCRAGETVVYSCPMKGKVVSVCAKPGVVAYRYGPAQAPEIEIASNGRDGLLHFSTGVGGGGGHYTNLRFLRGGYSYIVFSGSPGSLHDVTEPWSGVQLLDGERDVARWSARVDGPSTI